MVYDVSFIISLVCQFLFHMWLATWIIVPLWYMLISGTSGPTHWIYLPSCTYSVFQMCPGVITSSYHSKHLSSLWSPTYLLSSPLCKRNFLHHESCPPPSWSHQPLLQLSLQLEYKARLFEFFKLNSTLAWTKAINGPDKEIHFRGKGGGRSIPLEGAPLSGVSGIQASGARTYSGTVPWCGLGVFPGCLASDAHSLVLLKILWAI